MGSQGVRHELATEQQHAPPERVLGSRTGNTNKTREEVHEVLGKKNMYIINVI